jgi:hypothetical protein
VTVDVIVETRRIFLLHIGFEVLTAVTMKSAIFGDLIPRRPLKLTDVSEEYIASIVISLCCLLLAGCFLSLLFEPDDEAVRASETSVNLSGYTTRPRR